MTTNNGLNLGLSGATGTGNFVGATSPTLVTPTLGAATATSVNFGGSTLSTYTTTTAWTPVFTFATPGNLSVVYTTQVGLYARIGNIVVATFNISCTPTYTTASGAFQVTGLPFASNATTSSNVIGPVYIAGTYNLASNTWPISSLPPGLSLLTFLACQSNTGGSTFTSSTFTTGDAIAISGSVTYLI